MHTLFLLLSAGLLLMFGPSAGPAGRRSSLPDTGPRITFDTLAYDYGTILLHGDGRCTFPFTNTGDAPLIIEVVQSSCGCLVPEWSQEPVLPGRSSAVKLKYDTSRVGPFIKSVTVRSNAVDAPVVVLRIKGTVRPRPEVVPP